MNDIETLADFSKGNGLLPVVIQNEMNGQVLMLGYTDREALRKTLETGKVWFFSRSKNRLWMKGEESGNFLELVDVRLDCDQDSFLYTVIPNGPTCHTGKNSCFGAETGQFHFLERLVGIIEDRKNAPSEGSYTSSLFREGLDRIAQKVGEEAVECVIAAKNKSNERLTEESADLLFHLLVLLSAKGISFREIIAELRKRHGK